MNFRSIYPVSKTVKRVHVYAVGIGISRLETSVNNVLITVFHVRHLHPVRCVWLDTLANIVSHVVTVRTMYVNRMASVCMDVKTGPMLAPVDVRDVPMTVLLVLLLQYVRLAITDTMVHNVKRRVVTVRTTGARLAAGVPMDV